MAWPGQDLPESPRQSSPAVPCGVPQNPRGLRSLKSVWGSWTPVVTAKPFSSPFLEDESRATALEEASLLLSHSESFLTPERGTQGTQRSASAPLRGDVSPCAQLWSLFFRRPFYTSPARKQTHREPFQWRGQRGPPKVSPAQAPQSGPLHRTRQRDQPPGGPRTLHRTRQRENRWPAQLAPSC